ncbi:MAG: M55 family metallopeptidase, partial [Victivallales bacterium]|nr:M55 family metallopeptidase [Victivallales bacterium]
LQHSRWEVNNGEIFLSEASMAAALAGDLGIPAVFVSGDDLLVGEVAGKIPGIGAAAVKKSLSPYQARSHTPAKAREMIFQGVADGIGLRRQIDPFRIPGPIRLNLIESLKGNHDQTGGYFHFSETGVAAETLTEAFDQFLRHLPWNNLDTKLPDGFEFP